MDCVIQQLVFNYQYCVLADFVKTCMITRPKAEFVNCSTHAVQTLFNEIPKGNEDIGLQILDPLKVPVVKVSMEFSDKLFMKSKLSWRTRGKIGK